LDAAAQLANASPGSDFSLVNSSSSTAPVTFYDMWRTPLNNSTARCMESLSWISALFDGQSEYTIDGIYQYDSGYSQMHDLVNQVL
jgi:hypothetical protein